MASSEIEKVREFWNNRPCNIMHSSYPIGSVAYFEATETRKYKVEPHIPEFADFASWKDKKVLEIGCGIGTDTVNFARAGAKVTAVDVSDVSLDVAGSRVRSEGLNASFYQADAEKLSRTIIPQDFDLIYSFGVIHHSPNPEEILKQIVKYASPESMIKIMVYHKYSWKSLWILLKYGKGQFWKWDQLIAQHSEAQFGCPFTHAYSKSSITQLLQKHGLCDVTVRVDHIFAYDITQYRQYRYQTVWYFRWMPKKLFRWLETKIGWHLLVEAHCR